MMVSSKGRYALRVMLDMALQPEDSYTSLKEIALRQQISLKYLEAIISILHREGFLDSQRGKLGGYRLHRKPSEYTAREILQLTEGTLAPVPCLDTGCTDCSQSPSCMTMGLWQNLDTLIGGYLGNITLQDILDGKSLKASQ